ncbi:hypothetical protein FSP39_024272 [Pinctada imbricata]|uniref:Cyclic nucleotide-binding domain-containing protein n=1 Tax=Pinctada imbricata TaxID=66713 RepID=A0AA88YK06_PINIB|nr:hypothetical protein FSP39_024272 [Pinctada imbricata]
MQSQGDFKFSVAIPKRKQSLTDDFLTEKKILDRKTRKRSVSTARDMRNSVTVNRWNRICRKIITCRTILKKQNQVSKCAIKACPLVKFKRVVKVIQLLIRATRFNTQGRGNEALLSWAHNDNVSKTEYEAHGLTFDPSYYRAKREIPLSNEAKVILSLDPEERTEGQHKVALIALNQAVEAFSEFPIKMQKSLVRVGWYEQFEDKRVIIRQGHKADNFYLILSGTAVVTILQTDKDTGEEVIRTVAVLKKGNSFGELALMYGSTRSATVTCKNSVELLAVGRQDFVDIFMPASKDSEPEHIKFLRTIQLLDGWPIEKLPYQNPKICCFMYFRRGIVLCKDSNSSEWVYIVKSGTCRILKALNVTKPQILKFGYHQDVKRNSFRLPPITPSHKLSQSSTQSSSTSSSSESSPRHFLAVPDFTTRHRKCNPCSLSDLLHKTNHYDEPMASEHRNIVDRILAKKHSYSNKNGKFTFKRYSTLPPTSAVNSESHKKEEIFVKIQNLGPRDTYGVEQVAFGQIGPTTSTVLVSEGAECILINRKFFRQYLSNEMAKKIRRTLRPIPTDESLQQKLQDKTNWEAYKSRTVENQVMFGQLQDSWHRYHFLT